MSGAPDPELESWLRWQSGLMARATSLGSGDGVLDSATRRRAALVLVDDLAAMAMAASERSVVALAGSLAGRGGEALMVNGQWSDRSSAALLNAVAANWNEVDEGYRPATCHGGLYSLPAAMAEVQAREGTLGDVLAALVAGYEVATGYARVLPPPRPLVLHPHATLSPVGAAAAVAAARGADGPGIEASVLVAATLASTGPFAHATRGVLARNGWAGAGAVLGFTAVDLAQAGVEADPRAPWEVLHEALGYPLERAELDNAWDRWAIHDGYHKSYACCQYAHSAVEAALELTNTVLADVPVDRIASVTVETHPLALPLDDRSPVTVLGAKFSVPHSVAAVLARGSADSRVFGEDLLAAPDIVRVRNLVQVEPYRGSMTPPFDRPAVVRVVLDTGVVVEAECRSAVGGPDRPLSEDDVLSKVALLTEQTMPGFLAVAEGIVDGSVEDSAQWSPTLERMWSS